jgi:hypothetical protein
MRGYWVRRRGRDEEKKKGKERRGRGGKGIE